MTNHPIAEQDSPMDELIARLRNGARFDDRLEAADTLARYRDALEKIQACRPNGGWPPHCAIAAKALATTKIEKE